MVLGIRQQLKGRHYSQCYDRPRCPFWQSGVYYPLMFDLYSLIYESALNHYYLLSLSYQHLLKLQCFSPILRLTFRQTVPKLNFINNVYIKIFIFLTMNIERLIPSKIFIVFNWCEFTPRYTLSHFTCKCSNILCPMWLYISSIVLNTLFTHQ